MDKEIASRIKKAGVAFSKLWFRVWKPGGITISTKIAVYRAVVLSVLLYGSASWNVYRTHVRRLETFHHRCLRKILKITWQQRIPTTEVLAKANISCVETMLIKLRLIWLGHTRRMLDERIPKMLLMSELLEGKRKPSKPYQRWKDQLKKDMKVFNVNNDTWWEDSDENNRSKWRKKIYEGG
jgi:hypothetical protein